MLASWSKTNSSGATDWNGEKSLWILGLLLFANFVSFTSWCIFLCSLQTGFRSSSIKTYNTAVCKPSRLLLCYIIAIIIIKSSTHHTISCKHTAFSLSFFTLVIFCLFSLFYVVYHDNSCWLLCFFVKLRGIFLYLYSQYVCIYV